MAVLARVDALLESLGRHVAHMVLAGALNDAQTKHLRFSLQVVDGLRELFAAERVRLGGGPTMPKES